MAAEKNVTLWVPFNEHAGEVTRIAQNFRAEPVLAHQGDDLFVKIKAPKNNLEKIQAELKKNKLPEGELKVEQPLLE